MNQLSGKHVNIVLSIEDIKGIGFVKYPIHIEAYFNGRPLESDKIIPDDPTSFNTELIWEVKKKDLRQLRSSNQPLKVECIANDTHTQKHRERIGFVLLSLRSAMIIPQQDSKKSIGLKWYKLMGCQADKKKFHPELSLALTIRDHLMNNFEENLSKNVPLSYEADQNNILNDPVPSEFELKYLEDGHIKIGDDFEIESFSLNLLLKEARNLDTLLPERLVFKSLTGKYHMSFKLFGVTIRTKLSYKHLKDTININEKLVIRLLSNQDTLFKYLKTQSVQITLFSDNNILGITEVNLDNLMTFEENDKRGYFHCDNIQSTMISDSDNLMPFIDIKMCIKRSNNNNNNTSSETNKSIISNPRSVADDSSPRGDGDWIDPDNCNAIEELHQEEVIPKIEITQSVETVIELSPRSFPQNYAISKTYTKHVMEVLLKNFIWLSAPEHQIVIFKFLHPRASSAITIFTQISKEVGETINLGTMGVNVTYVSADDQLENVLTSWPPKLVLTDEREQPLSELHKFETKNVASCERQNYRYTVELLTWKTLKPFAQLQINLQLYTSDFNQQTSIKTNTDFHLNPPIVDELLTLKEIRNLEEWKNGQMETFRNDLKCLRLEKTRKWENSWNDRRQVIEEKLDQQMMKCIQLQDELQKKIDEIETEKFLNRCRLQANIVQDIFIKNWENYNESDIKYILKHFSKIQRDNEYLKHLVNEQRNELKTMENLLLTKQETGNILNELKHLEKGFEDVQKAKQYFIEQWQISNAEIKPDKSEIVVEEKSEEKSADMNSN